MKYLTHTEDVAKILKISTPRLRLWNRVHKISSRPTKYLEEDILKAKIIKYLYTVELYTSAGVTRQIKLNYKKWQKLLK